MLPKILNLLPIITNISLNTEQSGECVKSDCKLIVNSIKNGMNLLADPCNDFHDFACGKWGKNNPMPYDTANWDAVNMVAKNTENQIEELFDNNVKLSNPSKAFGKAKKLFDNCMNLDAIEKTGLKTIYKKIMESGGWPAIMDRSVSSSTTLYKMHEYHSKIWNFHAFYDISVQPDAQKPNGNYIQIIGKYDSIFEFMSQAPYQVLSYRNIITNALEIFAKEAGSHLNKMQLQYNAMKIISFEHLLIQKLASVRSQDDKFMTPLYEFQKRYDSFSTTTNSEIIWTDFLHTILKNTGIRLSSNDIVIVNDAFFWGIASVLDQSSPQDVENYIQWKFLYSLMPYGPKNLRNLWLKLEEMKSGQKMMQFQKKTCSKLGYFKEAIQYEYVKRYFSEGIKHQVDDLVTKILDAAHEFPDKTSWLTYYEKNILHKKFSYVKRVIGYPNWYNEAAIDKHYQTCNINDNFIENLLEMKKCEAMISFTQLKSSTKNRFSLNPMDVNAYFAAQTNTILFTAAILQHPIFSLDYPRVIQYGAFGSIVGHEICHGIDNTGSNYDHTGNIHNLWTDTTKNKLISAEKCWTEQYNAYKAYDTAYEKIHVNGSRTINENMADLYGLICAYRAYENFSESNQYSTLPGLENFTNKQVFFLAYANGKCSVSHPASLKQFLLTDEHSPNKYRILGSLSNSKEFSKAFNCPVGAKMNPINKCQLWTAN